MTIRRWRTALLLLGLLLLALGGLTLLQEVSPKRYLGILSWLIAALILHDGIIAPAVFGLSLAFRRLQGRIPVVVIAILQGALVVGGIVTLLVVPEILKKSIGTLSSSILPENYAAHLALFWVALVALLAAAVAGYRWTFVRRQKLRSSANQD